MSEIDLALAFLSGVVTGVPTSVRAKGFRSKPDDNKGDPASGGRRPRTLTGPAHTRFWEDHACTGEPGWAAAMVGGCTMEVRKTGRGERDSPATNDLPITMRLAEPAELREWLRSA
jgi:hypothetical protein